MKSRITFIVVFWIVFIAGFGGYFYKKGSDYKAKCNLVTGTVIAQTNIPEYYMDKGVITSREQLFPVVQYNAGGNLLTYTEKNKKNLKVGETIDLLYEKADPAKQRLYNAGYWFQLSVFMPVFSIATFVFCILLITMTNYGKKPELLPGELDEFVYGDQGPHIIEQKAAVGADA